MRMTHVYQDHDYESTPIIPETYTVFRSRVSHEIMHLAFFQRPVDNTAVALVPVDAICGKATQLSVGKSERQLCDPSLVSSSLFLAPTHPFSSWSLQPRFPPRSLSLEAWSFEFTLSARDPLRGLMS